MARRARARRATLKRIQIFTTENTESAETMHYRNGREAKNGDTIIQLTTNGPARIVSFGILHDAVPGNDYCNGMIAVPVQQSGACMCDCIHLDDLAEILAEKGLDKRPARK